MKGLSELLIIVVTVITILIAAFVLVTIFGKGAGGVAGTADDVRATAYCGFRCTALCSLEGKKTAGEPTGWTAETVKVGDSSPSCSRYVPKCDCITGAEVPSTEKLTPSK